jgi:putative FmdB family regulatory protein
MPLYEYRCLTCGKGFEMLRRMKDADEALECPNCQSAEVERLLSTFATSGCGTSGSGKFT